MGAVTLNTGPSDGDEVQYKPLAEINITPFVDVMLVLLVIFMVAAPLMVAGVPVDLPQTSATRLSNPKKPMVVTLATDGTLQIREERVDKTSLIPRLLAIKAQEGDAVVYVRADRAIPYGEVMEVLGRVGEAGYQRVCLLSQPIPKGANPTSN